MINKVFGLCKNYKDVPQVIDSVKRIVAIGDVHGDYDYLIHLLKIALVINNKHHWIGGKTYVVQLGDQIDSCRPNYCDCNEKDATQNDTADDIKIINYLENLHNEATEKGGAVISLLGNHELMNIDGDMSYVSYKNLQEVGGIEKRKQLFSKNGEIGEKLICTHPAIVIIGSNLFVHAGILPKLVEDIPHIKEIYQQTINEHISNLSQKEIVNLLINCIIHENVNKKDLEKIDSEHMSFWNQLYSDNVDKKHFIHQIKDNSQLLNDLIKKYDVIKEYFINNKSIFNINQLHSVEIINDVVKLWLFEKIHDEETLENMKSIFWNRIIGNLPNENHKKTDSETCKTHVKPVLNFFNINHMVVGHTPQYIANQSGINYSCDSTVAKVDTGGSNAFNAFDSEYVKTGKKMKSRIPQVLVIDDDKNFRILYHETPSFSGGKFLDFFKYFYYM